MNDDELKRNVAVVMNDMNDMKRTLEAYGSLLRDDTVRRAAAKVRKKDAILVAAARNRQKNLPGTTVTAKEAAIAAECAVPYAYTLMEELAESSPDCSMMNRDGDVRKLRVRFGPEVEQAQERTETIWEPAEGTA